MFAMEFQHTNKTFQVLTLKILYHQGSPLANADHLSGPFLLFPVGLHHQTHVRSLDMFGMEF
jgi:hypothetical protein